MRDQTSTFPRTPRSQPRTDFFFGENSFNCKTGFEILEKRVCKKQETGSLVDPSWGAIPAYDRWTEILGKRD